MKANMILFECYQHKLEFHSNLKYTFPNPAVSGRIQIEAMSFNNMDLDELYYNVL